jgi:hypothetical protein
MENPRHRSHSFFWPILLVGVGIIWLLVNLGIIAPISVGTMLQFWPIMLIVLGLDILFSRRFVWIGSLVGILAVVGLIAYLLLMPKTGLQTATQAVQENFGAPIGETNTVSYNFETSSEPVDIYALGSDSNQLIDANLTHQGKIDFAVTGTTDKMVNLSETTNPADWFTWTLANTNLKWNIGLSTAVPSDITVDGGSGSISTDLTGVKVQTLTADLGSGSSTFTLPQSDQDLAVNINSGSGSVNVALPENTNMTLKLESASGSVDINLPSGAALQVVVMDSGSGSLSLPENLTRISGDQNAGTWQTSGYDLATKRIVIKILDRGSGSISIN